MFIVIGLSSDSTSVHTNNVMVQHFLFPINGVKDAKHSSEAAAEASSNTKVRVYKHRIYYAKGKLYANALNDWGGV